MRSMTGYGTAEGTFEDKHYVLQIKSVNHKYLDMRCRISEKYFELENIYRDMIKKKIDRGRIDLLLVETKAGVNNPDSAMNTEVLDFYHDLLKKISQRYGYPEPNLQDLLTFKHEFFEAEKDEDKDKLFAFLSDLLNRAMDRLIQTRSKEGEYLKEDLEVQIDKICEQLQTIKELAPTVQKDYEKKLKDKVLQVVNGGPIIEMRILTEVAIYADHSDINEEIIRFSTHLEHLNLLINQEGAIGRKIDFILQEMLREINTICSKSNHASLTRAAVEIKSLIDRLKEQIQNIE